MKRSFMLGLLFVVSACGSSTTPPAQDPSSQTGANQGNTEPIGTGADPVTNAPAGAPVSPDGMPTPPSGAPTPPPPGPASGTGTQ